MAYFQEDRPRGEPALRAPASVLVLIALLVLAHVLRSLLPQDASDAIVERFAFIPALYSSAWLAAHHMAAPSLFWRAVPFVSHIFLHANYVHVLFNSLWLLAFGPIVARRFGALPFYVFFLVCGIAGAATHLAVYQGSDAAVVGASGAISGVTAAAIRMMRFDIPFMPRQTLQPIFTRQVLSFSIVWMGVNAFVGVTGLGAGPVAGPIAWIAHVGGYLAGLLLSGAFDALAGQIRSGRQPA